MLGSPLPDAERFVAGTQALRDLTRRLAALRTRQARLGACFQQACAAVREDPASAGSVLLARRLDALLTRVEHRQDGVVAAAEALVVRLGDGR